jgi:hypothetical protein
VWVAEGSSLHSVDLRRDGERLIATDRKVIELSGPVARLVAAPGGGVLACVAAGEGTTLELLEGDRRRTLATTESCGDVLVTRTALVSVEIRSGAAEIVSRDLRRGRLLRRLPLGSASATLRRGAGDKVAVIEGGGRIRIVDAARRIDECREPGGPGCRCERPRPQPGPSAVPPRDARCNCCKCGPPAGADGDGGPGEDAPPRRPHRDPDGACVPGDDGSPDGCLVAISRGRRIFIVDVCDPDARPCAVTVRHHVGTLHRTRAGLIARSLDGRRATIYEAASLRKVRSLTFEAGTEVQVLYDSDEIALLSPEGTLSVFATGAAAAGFNQIAAPAPAPAVFRGESPITLYDTDGPVTGTRTVMIVPVLEPGQDFSGSTRDYADYVDFRDMLEFVRDYYREASYHDEPDTQGLEIEFLWFGAQTPTVYEGPPVRLDVPFKTFWGPAWDPGHIRASIALPAGGTTVSFSGDETMTLRCIPSESESYDELDFTLRFPAGSYRSRIPDTITAITFDPAPPLRTIRIDGTDRQGAPVQFTVNTSVLSGPVQVNLGRMVLSNNPQPTLDALADVLEQMLDAGAPGVFERPSVVWQDDGVEGGILHVSISFAAGPGGTRPSLTLFHIGGLLPELGGTMGDGGVFVLPGDEGNLQTYLRRVVTDAQVVHPEFGPDLSEAYFELSLKWSPTVVLDGGTLTTRISLSTRHGRFPAKIELVGQTGLDPLGFDSPDEVEGANTSYSGGGGPKYDNALGRGLFNEVYTKMIDASISHHSGNEAAAIAAINERFNCVGLEQLPIECAFNMIHSVVVTPVYPTDGISGTTSEPDLVLGERGAAVNTSMNDLDADLRTSPVDPIGWSRMKVVMKMATSTTMEPDRHIGSARTLAHEIGHCILGLPDLYSGGNYRTDVLYMDAHCLMADTGSMSHFCAYNKRVKGWLDNGAISVFDRPSGGVELDEQVILVQLEYWDPSLGADAWDIIAQTVLPGAPPGTPVKAAVFLRLGGDGRQFDIIELRGPGPRFSATLSPPRLVISNAVDPTDDTRYAEGEVENAGVTEDVLERYRRKVHLLSDSLRAASVGTADDTYDFASDLNFPEVGLTARVLEWGTATTSAGSFDLARVRLNWARGRAINLGFRDGTPDWQSQDIAIIRPDGDQDFPEEQDDREGFLIPPEGAPPLLHKVGVRVWNFGDAEALNVQVGLVLRSPRGGGSGDWEKVSDFTTTLPDPIGPGASQVAFFDWPVPPGSHTHLCWRADIGDRDVSRDDVTGLALASDDTDASNSWAQQNVFEFEALGNSPPAPVEFTFEVANEGSYTEEVTVVPFGLLEGATVTVTPPRMRIAPRSRGLFEIRADLEERLLYARCGKDIEFRLVAMRAEDHAAEPWGSSYFVIKPRIATRTVLDGMILPTSLRFSGKVVPDVGAQSVLLQIDRPGEPTLWERVAMGPNATFDFELEGEFAANVTYSGVAYYEGSYEYGKSNSERVDKEYVQQG